MKRGQVQIQETILVLFVFMIILIIGLVFFHRYNIQSLENQIFDVELARFDSMLSTFPQNPEIRCSFLGQDISCIDSYKLLSFKDLVKNEKGYYRGKLGFKNITFYSLYPEKNSKLCDLSSVRDCGVWNVYMEKPEHYEKILIRESPISLYFPEIDDYGIGKMVIEWYT